MRESELISRRSGQRVPDRRSRSGKSMLAVLLELVAWNRQSGYTLLAERRVRETVFGLRRSVRYDRRREMKLL